MGQKYNLFGKKIAPLQYSAIVEYLELNGNLGYIVKSLKNEPKTIYSEPGFAGLNPLTTINLPNLRETLGGYL
ncbi:MAG: hypothetical protein Q8R00_01415 [Candidatus Nanoarchaeia archaeon]|nr:hypothetical protein [Candidatus Nanoarchaeia archaeon]